MVHAVLRNFTAKNWEKMYVLAKAGCRTGNGVMGMRHIYCGYVKVPAKQFVILGHIAAWMHEG